MRLVVAAVVTRGDEVLAARRRGPAQVAGRWEFPGGKVEPGEDPAAALRREIAEELGWDVDVLGRVGPEVDVPGIGVLRAYRAAPGPGDPGIGPDHDLLRWVAPAELTTLEWLPADLPIVSAVLADAGMPPRGPDGRLGA